MRQARVTGRTRCPGCEKTLTDGRPVTDIKVTERGYGTSPSGHTYFREVPGVMTWHTVCLDQFNEQNARNQSRSRVQQMVDTYTAFVVGGHLTEDEWLTATRSGCLNTEAEVQQALTAARAS